MMFVALPFLAIAAAVLFRAVISLAGILLSAVSIVALGFFVFVLQIESQRAPDFVAGKRAADAVIVLTGGPHRVEEGARLFADGIAPRFLISGVHKGATKRDLLSRNVSDPSVRIRLNGMDLKPLEMGFVATTTEGNAVEVRDWATRYELKTAIVVTADSHMPRAMLLLSRAAPQVRFIADPVVRHPDGLKDPDYWRDIALEYGKICVAFVKGNAE